MREIAGNGNRDKDFDFGFDNIRDNKIVARFSLYRELQGYGLVDFGGLVFLRGKRFYGNGIARIKYYRGAAGSMDGGDL